MIDWLIDCVRFWWWKSFDVKNEEEMEEEEEEEFNFDDGRTVVVGGKWQIGFPSLYHTSLFSTTTHPSPFRLSSMLSNSQLRYPIVLLSILINRLFSAGIGFC